jgi:hypothetical protein
MDGAERTLPRDEFTVRLRELRDNPGAVSTSSRVDIPDFYGNHETWTVDTFRHDGIETAFVQRMSADGGLRMLVPPQVMSALVRGHETLTGKSRSRGARRAVETRIARGDVLGNPEALKKARSTRRKAKRR